METRANYIAVGFFTLAAVVTVFAVIYWFNRYGEDENLVPIDIRIQGSVSGLGPASTVQFNGIDVGRVGGLSLDSADPRFVIIHALINSATPVRSDTTASIGIRGLSGGAYIQLEGGSPTATPLLDISASPDEVPMISGDPSAVSDLIDRVNDIAGKTERMMSTLESFVDANSATLTRTLDNAEKFSQALADNSEGVAEFMSSAGDVAKSLQSMSDKLDGSLQRAEQILASVDPDSIKSTVENVESFTGSLAEQRQRVTEVVDTVNNTAKQLDQFTANLNETLSKVDGVVAAVDRDAVAATVANINKSAERAEQILASIEGENLNKTFTEVQAAASQARKILDAVDETQVKGLIADLSKAGKDASGLIENASGLIDSIDPDKINSAVDNISTAAEDAQTIVADVAKVTGPLGERAGDIDKIVNDVQSVASRAKTILDSVDETQVRSLIADLSKASGDVSKLVEAIDAAKINTAVDNISTAAEGAQTIVSDVSRVTAPLRDRAEDISQIVSDASELAARLNESSKRVDGILVQISDLVGSDVADGLMADVKSTLEQFRNTAANFDRQIASVANNVNAFTKRGLADTQGLIRDARQSLNRFDRVMRNLQSNPSSLITGAGGSRVRESSGTRIRR